MYKQAKAREADICVTGTEVNTSATSSNWTTHAYGAIYTESHTQKSRRKGRDGRQANMNTTPSTGHHIPSLSSVLFYALVLDINNDVVRCKDVQTQRPEFNTSRVLRFSSI